jgi:hypothetical protein
MPPLYSIFRIILNYSISILYKNIFLKFTITKIFFYGIPHFKVPVAT